MENDQYAKRQRIYKTIMLVTLTMFFTFMITSLSMYTRFSKKDVKVNVSSTEDRFSKVRNIIDKYYLWKDEINETDLEDASIKGYVSGLGDKYTEYIPSKDLKKFEENITGTYTGIGIAMISDKEKGIIVYEIMPNSPAEKAGMKIGDIIKKVDGKEFDYDSFDSVPDSIKGKEGTKVKIVIERDGKEIVFEVTREKINTNLIKSEIIDNKIGYISLPSFDENTFEFFKENLDNLIEKGATSLIIDLRQNGGGIVDEAEKIADLFLDKNLTIITTKDSNENEKVTKTKKDKQYDLPIILLGDESTASASEILIGALKDNNRAKFVGAQTFGKGIIQVVVTLSDGGAIKITTAEYFTPNGTAIHGIGIKPDIEIKNSNSEKGEDNQLNRAIEELKKR